MAHLIFLPAVLFLALATEADQPLPRNSVPTAPKPIAGKSDTAKPGSAKPESGSAKPANATPADEAALSIGDPAPKLEI
ncbi:MAG TPA: hypothetical protein VKB78_07385, partial [Pirellulales bacterium]|nr:hypothetical protein [Pirellulales bacterium]